MLIRPPSRDERAILKPCPSSPRRLDAGMVQSSKISSLVGEECSPILRSVLPKEKPGVPFSTMKQLTPAPPLPALVRAINRYMSASPPFVPHIFEPLEM